MASETARSHCNPIPSSLDAEKLRKVYDDTLDVLGEFDCSDYEHIIANVAAEVGRELAEKLTENAERCGERAEEGMGNEWNLRSRTWGTAADRVREWTGAGDE